MLPTLVDEPPAGPGWSFEVKWDGVRAIAYLPGDGTLRLESRNLIEITHRYPELAALPKALGHAAVLDGEIVAFDDAGRPSFERLAKRMGLADLRSVRALAPEIPANYLAFDLLHLDGADLFALPFAERRAHLESLRLEGPAWTVPPRLAGDGPTVLAATRDAGLEGIVAKRDDSPYQPGRRTRTWLKVKHFRRQEFVIGGYTRGEGNRAGTLGALLLGYYDAGALRYAGRVGTGFDAPLLRSLLKRLRSLERQTSPFADGGHLAGSVFVEPLLVAEVAFTEWTAAGMVRHPAFKGLRDDKDPRTVVREQGRRP